MHPSLHKLAVSFTCRPLENGTSRHGEHESTLVRPVVTMRLLQYTDNADFRNAVGKGGRERWIDRRILLLLDPHHAVAWFRNGNARKKKRKKKRGKEDDKKDCDVAMRLSVEDDRSVILNAWELLLITRIIRK